MVTASILSSQIQNLSARQAAPSGHDNTQDRLDAMRSQEQLEEQTKELRRIRKNLEGYGW